MNIVKPAIACAALALGGATSAHAADLIPIPEPIPPAEVEVFGGWYLRGDIGISNQKSENPKNPVLEALAAEREVIESAFGGASFFGVGVGYAFNSWFRADVTGEWRAASHYKGLDRVRWPAATGFNQANEFDATKTELVGLVNGYLDLGTWYGITPFVGAGVGVARVSIEGFRDVGTAINPANGALINSVAYAEDETTTNFAWALYAGLGYDVSPNLSLELAYRYLNMGDVKTGETRVYTGPGTLTDHWTFENLHSHDLKVGMRWNLQGPTPVYSGPISRSF